MHDPRKWSTRPNGKPKVLLAMKNILIERFFKELLLIYFAQEEIIAIRGTGKGTFNKAIRGLKFIILDFSLGMEKIHEIVSNCPRLNKASSCILLYSKGVAQQIQEINYKLFNGSGNKYQVHLISMEDAVIEIPEILQKAGKA